MTVGLSFCLSICTSNKCGEMLQPSLRLLCTLFLFFFAKYALIQQKNYQLDTITIFTRYWIVNSYVLCSVTRNDDFVSKNLTETDFIICLVLCSIISKLFQMYATTNKWMVQQKYFFFFLIWSLFHTHFTWIRHLL